MLPDGGTTDDAEMSAARYWDLQLVQNYIYPNATLGVEPLATNLKAAPDQLIKMFPLRKTQKILHRKKIQHYLMQKIQKELKNILIKLKKKEMSIKNYLNP